MGVSPWNVLFEGLYNDLIFASDLQYHAERLLMFADGTGALEQQGDVLKARFALSGEQALLLSARVNKRGAISEVSFEHQLWVDSLDPDKIVATMYYLDSSCPVVARKTLTHSRNTSWGDIGLPVEEKIVLLTDPSVRQQYKMDDIAREDLLVLLAHRI